MTETKFTPGPWEWRRQWAWEADLHGPNGEKVLYATYDDSAVEWDNSADAQLIASAPLLYEALRQLERAFAVGAEGYRAVADREGALRAARAALRAARGEEA